MENLNYRTSVVERSWSLPRRDPNRKTTWGFWLKYSISKPSIVSGVNHRKDRPQFEYSNTLPKSQIRVLLLNPGRNFEPLSGSLKTISRDGSAAHGGYEALSYMWGVSDGAYSMTLDGQNFTLSTNLYSALLKLRSSHRVKPVWCDAICINQSDKREKSAQISIMRDIYFSATRVFVWLGPAAADSKVGMRILHHFAQGGDFRSSAPWLILPPASVASGLEDVTSRGWFSRFWVVQEAALAREVVMACGDDQVTWQNDCCTVLRFLRGIKLAISSPQWQSGTLRDVDLDDLVGLLQMQLDNGPDSRVWARRKNNPDILEHVYSMRHRQATDARDRIYSLVGMMKPSGGHHLHLDYSKTPEAVYDKFADLVVKDTEHLCGELLRLKNEDANHHTISGLQAKSIGAHSEQPLQLDQFIKQAGAKAMLEVQNNRPHAASAILESAAMFLRSQSFRRFQ